MQLQLKALPLTDPQHIPVLPQACLDLLKPEPGQHIVDCTLGRGGHAELMIPHLKPGGQYTAFEVDPGNADFAEQRLTPLAAEHDVALNIHRCNFRELNRHVSPDSVNGLLADLGFASNQVDDATRGFSFLHDGPLDMRLNPDLAISAADMVNTMPEEPLANLIYELGEERFSRRIARKIVEVRQVSPIEHTSELAALVRQCYGKQASRSPIHPATRTFMALRIAVNDELGALDQLLDDLPSIMAPNGIVGIISFHSLEDRRVKQRFQQFESVKDEVTGMELSSLGKRLTRKPIVADDAEIAGNSRSRSAKLRGFQFSANPHTESK